MNELSTPSYSVTIDRIQETISFFRRGMLRGQQPARVIPFIDVLQVQLSSWEDSYTVPDQYTSQTLTRRGWAISLALRDGTSAAIAQGSSDQGLVGRVLDAQGRAAWEALALRVSEDIGRPLVRMGDVPGGPHTFVEAIEWFVQQRLRRSGPSDISVHIRTARDLGVEIVVNGKVFTAVEKVEPEAVRHLIEEAIDEWQRGADHDG